MELLMISLFFTILGIFLVDYVQGVIGDIKIWWGNKQYEKKRNKIK